jgi:hypothetical protein
MKEKRKVRTEKLYQVRLTPNEKEELEEEFLTSFFPSRSELFRYKLLNKTYCPVKEKQFEKIVMVGGFSEELNQIGDKINQIAKRMNTYKDGKIMKQELLTLVEMIKILGKFKDILVGI